VTCPSHLDGHSLHQALIGKQPFPRESFVETEYDSALESIIRDDFKLIRSQTTDELELYNLKSDPGETDNLATEHPNRAIELGRHLDRIAKGISNRARLASHINTSQPSLAEQKRLASQLKALGYLAEPEQWSATQNGNRGGAASITGLTDGKWPYRRRSWQTILHENSVHNASQMNWIETNWKRDKNPPHWLWSAGTGEDFLSFEQEFQIAYLLFAPMRHPGFIEVEVDGQPWDQIELASIETHMVAIPIYTQKYKTHEVRVRVLPDLQLGKQNSNGRVLFHGLVVRHPDAPPVKRISGTRGRLRQGEVILDHQPGTPAFLETDPGRAIYIMGIPYHGSPFELTVGQTLRITAKEAVGGVSITYKARTNEFRVKSIPEEQTLLPSRFLLFGPKAKPRVSIDKGRVRSIEPISYRRQPGYTIELSPQ
jgi:hypothetical protein